MVDEGAAMLTLADVRFGFTERPEFLGPVNLTVERGQCWAIVGPNGAGKSTLLRLMAGLRKPHGGTVSYRGSSVTAMLGRIRAQHIACMPQSAPQGLDMCAGEVVLMGRFPHRSLGLFESAGDRAIADRAMEMTGTGGFADRRMVTLSGGEAQRVHLAAALAQEPRILLVDEPTASLDLQHQLAIFRILHARAAGELAVVVVTHDVNLAALFCSHVALLHDGRVVAVGEPREVLTPDVLGPVYGVDLVAIPVAGGGQCRWIIPQQGTSGGHR